MEEFPGNLKKELDNLSRKKQVIKTKYLLGKMCDKEEILAALESENILAESYPIRTID